MVTERDDVGDVGDVQAYWFDKGVILLDALAHESGDEELIRLARRALLELATGRVSPATLLWFSELHTTDWDFQRNCASALIAEATLLGRVRA